MYKFQFHFKPSLALLNIFPYNVNMGILIHVAEEMVRMITSV